MKRIRQAAVILAMGIFSPSAFAAETAVTLDTRPQVTLRFLLLKPDKPVASVILFAGGHGALRLKGTAINWGKGNFLVRTREQFAKHNLQVAVVDAPSDRQGEAGMLNGFRNTGAHVTDVQAVVTYLKQQVDVPVWLIGTSRGTESAAYVGIKSPRDIAGVVLTSTMTHPNRHGYAVTELALDTLRLPVLIVSHKQDGCAHTPAADASRLKAMLTASPKVEIAIFEGGDPPRSDPCDAFSQHGYLGIEPKVVDFIAGFIKSAEKR